MAKRPIQNLSYCARLRRQGEVAAMERGPIMHKKRGIAIAVLAAVALAAALAWLSGGPRHPLHAVTAPKSGQAHSGPGTQSPARANSVAPSPTSPLLKVDLAALTLRADRGDPKAACLLGFKLLRCARVDMIARDVRLMGEAMPSDLDATNRQHLLKARPAARAFVDSCRGAPAESAQLGFQYVRQAALAGEPEAMYRYARGDVTLMDPWDPNSEQFSLWTEEADGMLLGAFEGGYTPAVMTLWEAYVDDISPLSQLIADDRLKAQALEFLMMRLRGDSVETTGQGMRYPDVAMPAAALASKWQRTYFASVPIGKDVELQLPHAGVGDIFADESSRRAWKRVATCSQ